MAALIFPNNTIANEHRYPVLLSLDYIPDLSNSFAAGLKSGNPNRERGTNFEMGGVQRFRSVGTDVLETPSGGECAHRSRTKHVDDLHHAKDQRNHRKY